MDDSILSDLLELLQEAKTEEELQVVMDLYDEYQQSESGDTLDDWLEEADTEEEISAIIDIYNDQQSEVDDDNNEREIEIEEDDNQITWYDSTDPEDDPEPGQEEDDWEREWIDANGETHVIHRGEPTTEGAEIRVGMLEEFDEALNYIEEIGAGMGYFDVFEDASGHFSVWYVG